MAERCERLVVMSRLAVDLLETSYAVPRDRIRVIPHGIPDMRADERDVSKSRFGLTGPARLADVRVAQPLQGDRGRHPGAAEARRAVPRPDLPGGRRHAPRGQASRRRGVPRARWSARPSRWGFATTSSSATSSSSCPSCAGISRRRTSTSHRTFTRRRSRAARWPTPWGPGPLPCLDAVLVCQGAAGRGTRAPVRLQRSRRGSATSCDRCWATRTRWRARSAARTRSRGECSGRRSEPTTSS